MSRFIENQMHQLIRPQIPVNSTTLRANAGMSHTDSDRRSSKIAHAFDWRACFTAWRKLWLYLAQSQQQMCVTLITDNTIEQMKNNLDITDVDLEWALRRRSAKPLEMIMHQTFCFGRAAGRSTAGRINYAVPAEFVSRNCHAMLVREALDIFIPRLPEVMNKLRKFAVSNKSRRGVFHPCRQYTQISTIGSRAADWVLDLGRDLMVLEKIRDDILLCGTQGTKAEMTHLIRVLGGDVRSCEQLDIMLCQYAGFKGCYDAEKIPTEI
ncbi:Ff.00g022500.m01.CDS01 [Fusarium sp. VM40]|nr:Ff.00g022500.m01.CDS01 [Fusarium sp. VM40]